MSVVVLSVEDLRRVLREELRGLATAPAAPADRRVTQTEAAAAAGVCPATLRAWEGEGLLKRYGKRRASRYALSEVLSVASTKEPKQLSADAWADEKAKKRT